MSRGLTVLGLACVGLVFLALSLPNRDPMLLYNPSASAPIGWYRIEVRKTYSVGEQVAAWLPDEAEQLAVNRGYLPKNTPVIKVVWARPGSQYCIHAGMLTTAKQVPLKIIPFDGEGRAMPEVTGGCRRLNAGEYILASDRVKTSFDSRYFGPVDEELILGLAHYVGSFEVENGRNSRNMGGARGRGAQGKIKGPGTNAPVSPCLHINFNSTDFSNAVLTELESCNSYCKIKWYHFTIRHDCSRGFQR